MNIFVIGCGRWGSLITWYLDHIGHHVTLYGRQSSPRMQSFLATRQNDLLTLPDSVGLTTDLRDVEQAETVINDAKAYPSAPRACVLCWQRRLCRPCEARRWCCA